MTTYTKGNGSIVIGEGDKNGVEMFFNKGSKSGDFEILYDSRTGNVQLFKFEDDQLQEIMPMTKKQFFELKRFLKKLRLRKNVKF